MSDEYIIKSVEICKTGETCRGCPYRLLDTSECVCELMKDVFDLINRQKADIERLKKNIDGLNIFTTNHMKVIRLQAIKEFAKRLKGYAIGENGSKEKAYFFVEVQDIDKLVKEMTEE